MGENIGDYLNLRRAPENVNLKHKQGLNFQDRIALVITRSVGSMYAVYFFILFIMGWIFWQLNDTKPLDPFPFIFLLFIGNVVQLLLMPLIMVGQNLQGKHAERRAEEEYKTTETIYKDIEKIFIHLDKQDKEIQKQTELLNQLLEKKK
ncbi:MAG: DUF1003 domain-containing protein [Candidatus Daviesbacteria bacterium]|nr:DUF1003 domain-containing protein [Candidatus Daviesbacteria bacterium]